MFSRDKNNKISEKTWWIFSAAILMASLWLHIVTISSADERLGARGDERDYITYAVNLELHGIFSRTLVNNGQAVPPPDALRAPGYPFFALGFVNVDARHLGMPTIILMQSLLGSATVLLSLLLFRRLLPPGWALLAGGLTALSPHLINSSIYILSETLFTFCLALHLLCLERGWSMRSPKWMFAAGITLAASIMVRPTTQYLAIFYVAAALLLNGIPWRTRAIAIALLVIPAILSVGAWGLRNIEQTGEFADSTLQANFLHHGMYINMMYEGRPDTYGYPYRHDPKSAELSGNTAGVLAEIAARAAADPAGYLRWYLLGKPIQFLAWDLTESIGGPFIYAPRKSAWLDQPALVTISRVMHALHAPLMILAAIGSALVLISLIRHKTGSGPLDPGGIVIAIVFAYFVAIHMVGAPFPRYSIPLRPVCYALACVTLVAIWEQARARWQGHRS